MESQSIIVTLSAMGEGTCRVNISFDPPLAGDASTDRENMTEDEKILQDAASVISAYLADFIS